MNIEAGPHQAAQRSSGCARFFAYGCAGFALMVIVVLILFYIMYTDLTAWVLEYRSDAYLHTSQIEESYKDGIRQQRDRLLQAYEAGELNDQQLLDFGVQLYNHPVFPAFMRLTLAADVLPGSGLDQQQQDHLLNELQRLTAAMRQAAITGDDYVAVIDPILSFSDKQMPQLRSDVTDADLLAVAAKARELADLHGVSTEPADYALLSELQRLIDATIGADER